MTVDNNNLEVRGTAKEQRFFVTGPLRVDAVQSRTDSAPSLVPAFSLGFSYGNATHGLGASIDLTSSSSEPNSTNFAGYLTYRRTLLGGDKQFDRTLDVWAKPFYRFSSDSRDLSYDEWQHWRNDTEQGNAVHADQHTAGLALSLTFMPFPWRISPYFELGAEVEHHWRKNTIAGDVDSGERVNIPNLGSTPLWEPGDIGGYNSRGWGVAAVASLGLAFR